MVVPASQSGPDPLDIARAHLTKAEWQSAALAFEMAIVVEETAEAVEGLSWAAWWLDDAPRVFTARERAYHLYRKAGDVAAAARMATWLACDHLDFRGAFAPASGWFARAHRLLEGREEGAEHGWLAFFEGYVALGRGDTAQARTLAARASAAGRRWDVPDLMMLGLALQGAALVNCADVEAGMRCLDEATAAALAGEAEIPIAGAWACCFLVTACAAARDYERAFEWCDRIAEFAERYGSRYMLAFCRAEYGAVHLWRGRWKDAERVLEESVEDFSRSRPAMVGAPLVALAELRRRQGRFLDAGQLLDQAGPSTAVQLCRARLAFDQGDTLRAIELAERLLRRVPLQCLLERAPALELLVHARIARGELDEARSSLDALMAIERLVGTAPVHAATELAEGILAAATGAHEDARRLIEDAVDGFERSGGLFEAAQARVELATSLLGLSRSDAAEREAGAALTHLLDLGAAAEAKRARRILGACRRSETSVLTRRESEVLRLVAEGLTNRQVAERLVVSEHTVHRHVTNILRKLNLPSRTAAAAHALRSGMRPSPDA